MLKRQIRELPSRLLPYTSWFKRRLALFTLMLLLAMTPVEFDSVHLHVEPEHIVATVAVPWAASGNVSARAISYSWPGKLPQFAAFFLAAPDPPIKL